jgi:uncharacterized protein YndB with AHSA1/START domain
MGHLSNSILISATPQQVWAILSDVTRLPEWSFKEGRFPYPVEGRYGSDQTEGEGTLWVGIATDAQQATQKVTVWEPPYKLAYEQQATENAPLQLSQTSTFSLQPAGDQTELTWSVDWEIGGGFSLNRLLLWFTGNSAFEEMMTGSLENLKTLIEAELSPTGPDEND